ncbi:hypothetical protein GE09DRAFT_4166 [Coniochaeta sp. 2T2.1]|nr:hypothetical protein GE09DRAFT_4166 [Coniochaeta sp. 2T2.1]
MRWPSLAPAICISHVAVQQSPETDFVTAGCSSEAWLFPALCCLSSNTLVSRSADCYHPRQRRGSPQTRSILNRPLMIDWPACLDSLLTKAQIHCNPKPPKARKGTQTSFRPIPCSPVLGLASAGLVSPRPLGSSQCLIKGDSKHNAWLCPLYTLAPVMIGSSADDRGSVTVKQSTLMVIMHKTDSQLTIRRRGLVQRPSLGSLFSLSSPFLSSFSSLCLGWSLFIN